MAGGVLIYVQSQRPSPRAELPADSTPKVPADSTPKLTVENAPQQLPTLEISLPLAVHATASVVPTRAYPETIAVAPTAPDNLLPQTLPIVAPAVSNMFPDDRPGPAASVTPSLKEFWTSSVSLELDRSGDDQKLSFLNKRTDEDEPLTFDFSNTAGIGSQYLLVKSAETTFLGRVASRFSQVYPGLSEEERVSEVFLGCQFEHRLNRRNKIVSALEYARDPAEITTHRVRTQAAWEVLLDPEENLSLRTSVLESSNYVPNREQAKNLNYNMNLIWKF